MNRTTPRLLIVGITVAFAALIGISYLVLDLEADAHRARVESAHRDSQRLALWRIDSWLASYLAVEAARAPSEYAVIDLAAAVELPPLLRFNSEFIRIHIEVAIPPESGGAESGGAESSSKAAGKSAPSPVVGPKEGEFAVCSPQVPFNNDDQLEIELSTRFFANGLVLAEARALLDLPRALAEVERREQSVLAGPQQVAFVADDPLTNDFSQRAQLNQQIANYAPVDVDERRFAGPLVPVWIPQRDGDAALFYLRRVRDERAPTLQGFLVDWERLQSALIEEGGVALEGARIVPVVDEAAASDGDALRSAMQLATVPALLEAPMPAVTPPRWSPSKSALLLTWFAAGIAALAVIATVRASMHFGERRQRFASAVTHELRTPLTTFQLYSEMLADRMVTDDAQRQEYYDTLKAESARLSTLVESVLTYSRVEEGRLDRRPVEITPDALIEAIRPRLDARVTAVGGTLDFETRDRRGSTTAPFLVDSAIVEQIVFNLVDNSTKYGVSATASDEARLHVEIELDVTDSRLEVHVRDHGPGIPAAARRTIFEPFDRGEHESTNTAGVGLGLPLSRELAVALGGNLELEAPTGTTGAAFRLTLPIAVVPTS